MKVAHLILAHKNPVQLLQLIEALKYQEFAFFIHVDKKVNIQPFKTLINGKNIYFLEKREIIYWGDFGTVQATLNGFEQIIAEGYDYINVISGQDFPIKPAAFIYHYLLERKGKEFITCDAIEGDWAEVASRVQDYHLVNWRIPGKYRLSKLLTYLLPKRVFPSNLKIVGRANWFTLTNEAVYYCIDYLKAHPEIIRYFKYCWGADEFVFSTLLYNSHFKDKIEDNLLYVDWSTTDIGHPRVLSYHDFDNLKKSPKLFARKFDIEINPTILSQLSIRNKNFS